MNIHKCYGIKNGRQCGNAHLIKAHIVPCGFAREIRGVDNNIYVTAQGAHKPSNQLGTFDKQILCAACDRVLGTYDKYGLETCRRFSVEATKDIDPRKWTMQNVDGDRFATFILSILWRASISKRPEFKTLSLGPYKNIARDVLYGLKPLALMPAFELMLARYKSNRFHTERFYTDPKRTRFGEYQGYGIGIGGFQVFAKMDSRMFPMQWKPYIVNGNDTLHGFFKDIENTDEYDLMVRAALKG
jgi:hypothetical protein